VAASVYQLVAHEVGGGEGFKTLSLRAVRYDTKEERVTRETVFQAVVSSYVKETYYEAYIFGTCMGNVNSRKIRYAIYM